MHPLRSLRGWLLLGIALILDTAHGQSEVTVTSGRELQTAIASGATSVVITEHLDARPLGSPDGATIVLTKELFMRVRNARFLSSQVLLWHPCFGDVARPRSSRAAVFYSKQLRDSSAFFSLWRCFHSLARLALAR